MKTKKRKQSKRRRRQLGEFPLAFGRYLGRPIRSIPHSYGNPGAPLQGQSVLYSGSDASAFIESFSEFGFCFSV